MRSIPATVSVGVALASAIEANMDQLVSAADRALYSAKAAGRNCTVIFGEEEAAAPAAWRSRTPMPANSCRRSTIRWKHYAAWVYFPAQAEWPSFRGLANPLSLCRMMIPPFLTIDPATRHVSLDGSNPAFYSDPNAVYAALHAHCPTFYWEQQKQWFVTGYDHVNGLLRDRRFGRQILHIASREELGLPEPDRTSPNFDLAERYSLLELEPPEHTRLRTLVNRAFVSRHVERMKPELDRARQQADRRLCRQDGEVELLSAFADIIPVTMIARMIGIPEEMGPQLLKWSHAYVRMYMFGRTRAGRRCCGAGSREFSDYVKTVIAERRAESA